MPKLWQCVLCEFVCTTFMLMFGTSSTAQFSLGRSHNGDYLAQSLGWGLGVMFSVQLGWKVTGAHINPAVSLFSWTRREISLVRLCLYWIAQLIGGFCGAALTFLEYREAISSFDGGIRQVTGPNATAGIFTTFPQEYLSIGGGFVDQILGTIVLLFVIGSICDARNGVPDFLKPVFIGTLIVLIGVCLGLNSGYAINPARDLGPRIFLFVAGHRHGTWWIVPVIGPLIGALVGGWLFCAFRTLTGSETTTRRKSFSNESSVIENKKKLSGSMLDV